MSFIEEIKTEQKIDLQRIGKKVVNLAIFGHGNVGGKLVDQIISESDIIADRRDIELRVFAISNSKTALFNTLGIAADWELEKKQFGNTYLVEDIIQFALNNNLDNLIAIDNTASESFVTHYKTLIENGFHLVSSNKIANTLTFQYYNMLRNILHKNKKHYLYETNVGAGLPLIDTIRLLHLSGENITRIKGVFSGSLSYIFNTFSEKNQTFSSVVKSAIAKGYTEPDPREDLSGNDVARKLLILARELDLNNELDNVSIQNLVPKELRNISKEEFIENLADMDVPYILKRKNLAKEQVLRYVGDLHGNLSKIDGGKLDVKLISVSKNTPLGQLKGSDSLFEIYTENYGDHPIVIQGAGAGAEVTARGVFGDILRLTEKLN